MAAPTISRAHGHPAHPQTQSGNSGIYRYPVGKAMVTVLTDGELPFPPHPTFGGDQFSREQVNSVLTEHYYPTDVIRAQLNLAIIEAGNTVTLVDAGYGERGREGTGQLWGNIQNAGYGAGDIDRVVITHAHPDHFNGLTTADGNPLYPNAEVLISEPEAATWQRTDEQIAEMQAAENPMTGVFATNNQIMSQLGDRLRTIAADTKFTDHLTGIELHGHTPGHIGVMVQDGDETLAILGDAANHEVLTTVLPDIPFGFDFDPAAAAATRRDIFGRLAADRIPALGYHWSFPGIGYIGRHGDAFRYYAKPWAWP